MHDIAEKSISGSKYWNVPVLANTQWRNRRGEQSAPQRLLIGKFLLTYREKRGKEKRENVAEKKENREREGGKELKMEWGKVTKWGEDFFFFFSPFPND